MPEAICASVSPVSGRLCTGPALHRESKSMCGNGDERWWHPDSEEGRREARDRAATAARSLQRETMPEREWVGALIDWAMDQSDAPLDFTGAQVPAKVQMLLGRAFSDVAELVGAQVTVTIGSGQQDSWGTHGRLENVHRDATGAPYALVLRCGAVPLTIPWHAVQVIEPLEE